MPRRSKKLEKGKKTSEIGGEKEKNQQGLRRSERLKQRQSSSGSQGSDKMIPSQYQRLKSRSQFSEAKTTKTLKQGNTTTRRSERLKAKKKVLDNQKKEASLPKRKDIPNYLEGHSRPPTRVKGRQGDHTSPYVLFIEYIKRYIEIKIAPSSVVFGNNWEDKVKLLMLGVNPLFYLERSGNSGGKNTKNTTMDVVSAYIQKKLKEFEKNIKISPKIYQAISNALETTDQKEGLKKLMDNTEELYRREYMQIMKDVGNITIRGLNKLPLVAFLPPPNTKKDLGEGARVRKANNVLLGIRARAEALIKIKAVIEDQKTSKSTKSNQPEEIREKISLLYLQSIYYDLDEKELKQKWDELKSFIKEGGQHKDPGLLDKADIARLKGFWNISTKDFGDWVSLQTTEIECIVDSMGAFLYCPSNIGSNSLHNIVAKHIMLAIGAYALEGYEEPVAKAFVQHINTARSKLSSNDTVELDLVLNILKEELEYHINFSGSLTETFSSTVSFEGGSSSEEESEEQSQSTITNSL